MYTCICGKTYETNSGFKTHQRACIEYNAAEAPFVCLCGKACPTPSHLWSHQKYCKVYCDSVGKPVRDPKKDPHNSERGKFFRGHSKSENTAQGEYLRQRAKITSERNLAQGDQNPIVQWNNSGPKSREFYLRQVETRQQHYLDKTLDLPVGIGKGDTVFFEYKSQKFCLRSSYEFIYAMFLALQDISFEYEAVRIKSDTKLYFSDFSFDDKVVEIKGQPTTKEVEASKVFEAAGYVYTVLYEPDILKIRDSLADKIDWNPLLTKIHECSKSRQYMTFNFEDYVTRYNISMR